jgi:signal transduction histidine kinase/phage shock protein PspC (stress-responsive transcriptional regulator)
VAGVAAGLGRRIGVDPVLVRITFVVLTLAGGIGVLLYGVLWATTDLGRSTPTEDPPPLSTQQAVALGLIVFGVLLLLRLTGLWFGDALVWPIALAGLGSAIVWARSDDADRSRWTRATARLPRGPLAAAGAGRVSPTRVIVGTVLVAAGVGGFLAANEGLQALGDLALAVAAAVGGLVLLFGPWSWRLVEQLGAERRERIRHEERAELAAHLHDSVLQTLALIQRSADQPRRMVALARRQERELRSWLYGQQEGAPTITLTDAVEGVAEEVEAIHDLSVEVVVVGDAPMDEHLRALLAATREACVNAAKHSGADEVSVYVEVDADAVNAFVRDRGVGFDPATVPADRRGIRGSISGRLERHGGYARVTSAPGEGTEVELCVPLDGRSGHPDDPSAAPIHDSEPPP